MAGAGKGMADAAKGMGDGAGSAMAGAGKGVGDAHGQGK